MPYANNKDTDQLAHLCSLISAFVFRWLDSIKHALHTVYPPVIISEEKSDREKTCLLEHATFRRISYLFIFS